MRYLGCKAILRHREREECMNELSYPIHRRYESRNTYLVRVATDRRHALYPEIESLDREAGGVEEGHDEAAQTAVDVQADLVLLGQLSESDDIVLTAIWEINR